MIMMLQRYLSNRFVTMKGTVNFERLTCSNQHYMRITLNDAVKLCSTRTPAEGQPTPIPELSAEQLIKTVRSRVERKKEFFMQLRVDYLDPSEPAIFAGNEELQELQEQGVLFLLLYYNHQYWPMKLVAEGKYKERRSGGVKYNSLLSFSTCHTPWT